jgi:DnaJ-class molecular chaperone
MTFDNYPPGAANDPSAPYNQKEPVMRECDQCNGTGEVDVEYSGVVVIEVCDECNGTGETEVEEE